MGISRTGSWNYIVCTSSTHPNPPTTGMLIFETDTKRLMLYDGSNWRFYGPPAGIYDKRVRTGGNLSLNNTSWTDLNPGWDSSAAQDITLAAVAGDLIEYTIQGLMGNEAVGSDLDVKCTASGNYFGSASDPSSNDGVVGWRGPTGFTAGLTGSALRVLVSGDISGGSVALRLRYKTDSSANKNLYASTVDPLWVWARNLGPTT